MPGTKGQIALWMLTKMAMLFFIIALALIITGLGNTQRSSVCTSQAQFVANAVSGTITNVINSPVEDERKILALDPVLSVGKTDYDRYDIQLTKTTRSSGELANSGLFSIYVKAASEGCTGSSSSPFERFTVRMLGQQGRIDETSVGQMIDLQPSAIQQPSRFMVVIKCKEKTPNVFPPTNFIFIQDCVAQSGDDCLGFSADEVNQDCGFKT